MSCGISLVKFVLFVFNLICALCGIALITAGVGVILKFEDILNGLETSNIRLYPIVFIVIGSAVFLIAFFGCCGAINESECMTSTYAVLLFLLLIAQIVVGILIFTNRHEFQQLYIRELNKLWIDRQQPRTYKLWNGIQETLKCCGYEHDTDWKQSQMPKSCCPDPDATECIQLVNTYKTGCKQALTDIIGTGSFAFGTFAISVAAVELVGFIFACILSNHIRNYKRRLAY